MKERSLNLDDFTLKLARFMKNPAFGLNKNVDFENLL
jgi:hypothetical protein